MYSLSVFFFDKLILDMSFLGKLPQSNTRSRLCGEGPTGPAGNRHEIKRPGGTSRRWRRLRIASIRQLSFQNVRSRSVDQICQISF